MLPSLVHIKKCLFLFIWIAFFIIVFYVYLFHQKSNIPFPFDLYLISVNTGSATSILNTKASNDKSNVTVKKKSSITNAITTTNTVTKITTLTQHDDYELDEVNKTLISIQNYFSSNTKVATKINKSESCPMIPDNLGERIEINKKKISLTDLEKLYSNFPTLKIGGQSSPDKCLSRHKVAIIVPYRNREMNLMIFLRHMHPFLMKQNIDYGIYIIEPLKELTFNRGLLMNIGFLESLKMTKEKWECFMFHDVDLIPEDERNIYSCPTTPRHMSAAVSTFNYKLPYDSIFGGVSSLTKDQMREVNGYSNMYFGWGGEDDDFRARIVKHGYQISRYPLEIGRYLMVKHTRDQELNPKRFTLLNSATERSDREGLNSIEYKVENVETNLLYTRVFVSYNEKSIMDKKY